MDEMIKKILITVNKDHIELHDQHTGYSSKTSSFLILDDTYTIISYGVFKSEEAFKSHMIEVYLNTSKEDISKENLHVTYDQILEKRKIIENEGNELFWETERNKYKFHLVSSVDEFNPDLLCKLIKFELLKYQKSVKKKFMVKYNYDISVAHHSSLSPLINDDFRKKVVKTVNKAKTVIVNGDLVSWARH